MKPCFLLLALVATPARAEPVLVPSGQPVEFYEVIRDVRGSLGLVYRFRFVAPEIARESGSVGFEEAVGDMDHLCREYAITRLPNMGPRPRQVIISLSDTPVEFGQVSPENTQFFEVYRIEVDDCIWEAF